MPRDRVVLVTGGTRGLGLLLAQRFLLDSRVVVFGRSMDGIERARVLAPGVRPVQADVRHAYPVTTGVEWAKSISGSIDVLVCNAGVYEGEWREMVDTNLVGTIRCVEAVLPLMLRQGHGKIITLSGAGVGGKPVLGLAAYAATKAAVVQYTESKAADLAGTGITINAVAPGPQDDDAQRQRAVDCIVFLASAASDGITGRLISAARDDWESLASTYLSEDRFRLRRVTA